MFDPTAFDNIKFIVQAEVYDRDLAGLLHIHDRKDLVDLASMQRESSIVFSLVEQTDRKVAISIRSTIHQLAGELMQLPKAEPGVLLEVIYSGKAPHFTEEMMDILDRLWGEGRLVERRNIESDRQERMNEWRLDFQRTITEDMIEEMTDLVGFIVDTLQAMNK
ncbi:hypothetical protein [Bacillus sp. FJAT-42315]|uniref:hypothetical protein n=1 Tax=Bacillus sp. FJAT-42315 TaxID=2014077 RepID=UPI000C241C47|nr:hypothetical protein [Bacillus sp. FJAT-42315]